MVELTDLTRQHVATLFAPEEVEDVERLLADECTEDLLSIPNPTPWDLERLRFAALRLSGGSLPRLRAALDLAQVDWRDLLVASGFARDVRAHQNWRPRRFDLVVADRWREGNLPPGVELRVDTPVEVLSDVKRATTGTVTGLTGLEPEPRYRVRLASGEEVEKWQRLLRAAS